MKERQESILKAIVRYFISTATPVGSKMVQSLEKLDVSAATIRNEMADLEKDGFLEHPHTSSGRIPTASGYRFYVNDLTISPRQKKTVFDEFSQARKVHYEEKIADQRVFDCISILTKITPNIAFATVPSAEQTFFFGLSNILREPEFRSDVHFASQVVKALEEDLHHSLEQMNITEEISLFIGPENLIEEMRLCSLIAFKYSVLRIEGIIGILGPMRMPYSKNILALEAARAFLNEKFLES
ncbi:hypothetical protein HZA38_06660 [Candidatus Peregrinibacteria bacterium]|nr:hypothetical protein [Candidatus Peregrinibacteria bacterium]